MALISILYWPAVGRTHESPDASADGPVSADLAVGVGSAGAVGAGVEPAPLVGVVGVAHVAGRARAGVAGRVAAPRGNVVAEGIRA